MFMGEYRHTVDPKGRLIVPSKFRELLGAEFVVTRGLDGCLFVYPMESWEAYVEELKKLPLTGLDPDKRYYCSRNDRTYYGDELMNMGLLLDMEFTGSSVRKDSITRKNSGTDAGDYTSQLYVLECVDN